MTAKRSRLYEQKMYFYILTQWRTLLLPLILTLVKKQSTYPKLPNHETTFLSFISKSPRNVLSITCAPTHELFSVYRRYSYRYVYDKYFLSKQLPKFFWLVLWFSRRWNPSKAKSRFCSLPRDEAEKSCRGLQRDSGGRFLSAKLEHLSPDDYSKIQSRCSSCSRWMWGVVSMQFCRAFFAQNWNEFRLGPRNCPYLRSSRYKLWNEKLVPQHCHRRFASGMLCFLVCIVLTI